MKKRSYHIYLKCTLLVAFMLCALALCGYRLMKIQLVDSETYMSRKYSTYKYSQIIDATRGEIVDCNGEPIIVNKAGYSVVILPEQFPDDLAEGNEVLLKISDMLEECGVSPDISMPISNEAPYSFTTDDDDVLMKFKSTLGLNVYATADNCISKLMKDYEISQEYSEKQKMLLCGLRYEMLSREFSMNSRFILAEDIPLSAITEIKEMGITLPGVEIQEMPLRNVSRVILFRMR